MLIQQWTATILSEQSQQNRKNMKAIILAAGRGSRMQNLTDKTPKCLVELHGKPLLHWQLAALQAAGIDEVALVTGYRSELLALPHITKFHNPCWAETNMVSSLAYAEDWLLEGPCIVSYSDIFYTAETVRALIEAPNAILTITYDPNWLPHWQARFANPLDDAETFRLGIDGRQVIEIGGKPKSLLEIEGQYMGLLRVLPSGWQAMKTLRETMTADQRDRMHMTGTLQQLIDAGVKITSIPCHGEWGEIDSPDDLRVYAAPKK